MRDEPLDSVAQKLCTTVEMLREFELVRLDLHHQQERALPAAGPTGAEDEADRSPAAGS